MTKNCISIKNISYCERAYRTPEGGFIGCRVNSASSPPTIDLNIPGLKNVSKLKFLLE